MAGHPRKQIRHEREVGWPRVVHANARVAARIASSVSGISRAACTPPGVIIVVITRRSRAPAATADSIASSTEGAQNSL
jgi:hypothetical protein